MLNVNYHLLFKHHTSLYSSSVASVFLLVEGDKHDYFCIGEKKYLRSLIITLT